MTESKTFTLTCFNEDALGDPSVGSAKRGRRHMRMPWSRSVEPIVYLERDSLEPTHADPTQLTSIWYKQRF